MCSACDLLGGRKERRRFSLNRGFVGDYIGLEQKPAVLALLEKRERVIFADTVNKFDRRFKVRESRNLGLFLWEADYTVCNPRIVLV